MSKTNNTQLVIYSPRIAPRSVDFPKPRRVLDFIVVLLCLSAAVGSVYLFYQSLTQTLTSSLDPVGTVTVRYNSVQRRMSERVLWDRLLNESPLYPGDIIRVAELSGAVLNFDGNQLELEDNTLIRITVGSTGQPQIELSSGTLNLSSGENSGNINLVIGGKTVEAKQGTVLSASAVIEGPMLIVNEGTVSVIEDGISTEVDAGEQISINEFGTVIEQIKSETEPETVLAIESEPEIEVEAEIELETEQAAAIEPELPPEPAPPPAPPPPHAAPANMQPADGYSIGPAQIRTRILNFTWSPVDGANAYILTLHRQTEDGRQLIIRTDPLTRNDWTLTDFSILDIGTFVWQIEAITRNPNGTIQRRGGIGENVFTVDIPTPEVQLHSVEGGLYVSQ